MFRNVLAFTNYCLLHPSVTQQNRSTRSIIIKTVVGNLKQSCIFKPECVVPENIHTPPPPHGRDFPYDPPPPHPSGNSNLASYIALNFWLFKTPPPPRNFQSLLWGKYGYFLEPHNNGYHCRNLPGVSDYFISNTCSVITVFMYSILIKEYWPFLCGYNSSSFFKFPTCQALSQNWHQANFYNGSHYSGLKIQDCLRLPTTVFMKPFQTLTLTIKNALS